jgi:5'-nucleotidase/UDP-sugar diphosphatase
MKTSLAWRAWPCLYATRMSLFDRTCRAASPGLLSASLVGALALSACTVQKDQPDLTGQDVRVTVIHTSDIHSRLFPYAFVPGRIDRDFGLDPAEGPFGGIARIGYIVKQERAKASRSLWLDSGDCFEGAPVFNQFKGEAEFRALTQLGLDAAVIGNHEFDLGANNLYEQIVSNAGFPLLAANYYFADPTEPGKPKLKEVTRPYQIFDLDGLKVAAIGMANWSSMTGIFEGGNSLGIRPINDGDTVRRYVSFLRPSVDLIVLVSHLGLDEDEGLASTEVEDENMGLPMDGVDLILGGHLHIVLNPPKIANVDAYGNQTVIVHSGAFAKYVGRLDLVVKKGTDNADPARRSHIEAFSYENIPVTCGVRANASDPCPHPEDKATLELLQPYSLMLNQVFDLDGVFAYVDSKADAKIVRNDASGGDSQLGNLVARAMQQRPGIDADFSITNSLGIRADFEQGPLTLEAMFNVFPFENSITVMYLSGSEVRETLDFISRKSSERGCRTQAQVAGITFDMVCGDDPHADNIYIGDHCRNDDGSIDEATTPCLPLVESGLYRVAVNDYIAAGGSGFYTLKANTSKLNTGIALRAALQDYIRNLAPCGVGVKDISDPTGGTYVVEKYGPITCLTDQDAHDNRIFPVFE